MEPHKNLSVVFVEMSVNILTLALVISMPLLALLNMILSFVRKEQSKLYRTRALTCLGLMVVGIVINFAMFG